MSPSLSNRSHCQICGTPNGFANGGWLCLAPYDAGAQPSPHYAVIGEPPGVACQHCTTGLVMAWAREFKRQGMTPDGAPTPTSPPTGSADAPLLEVRAA